MAGHAADGEPTCEKCNAEMDAAIGQALTNAQSEHSKYGGFLDRKYAIPPAFVQDCYGHCSPLIVWVTGMHRF